MMQYSCDTCGKQLGAEPDARFVVKLEAFSPSDCDEATDEELETNHIEEMARLLSEMEEDDEAPVPACKKVSSFDLCPECYRRFVSDSSALKTIDRGAGALIVKALTRPGAKAEEIARDIQRLYRALNEYHLAHGGSGLTVEDFEWMVAAAVAEGV